MEGFGIFYPRARAREGCEETLLVGTSRASPPIFQSHLLEVGRKICQAVTAAESRYLYGGGSGYEESWDPETFS